VLGSRQVLSYGYKWEGGGGSAVCGTKVGSWKIFAAIVGTVAFSGLTGPCVLLAPCIANEIC
jgi:hypothetical protein